MSEYTNFADFYEDTPAPSLGSSSRLIEDAAGNVGYFNPSVAGPAPSQGFSFDRLLDALGRSASRIGSRALTSFENRPISSTLTALAALQALRGGRSSAPSGYQGGINMALRAQRERLPQPEYVPYSGKPVMGRSYFTPVTYAAEGGSMGAPHVGMRSGDFVLPADFISDLGNGSSSAGLELAARHLGAQPIDGAGDGMSDSIDASIDGRQPARVARDEAVVPKEKVAELGGGDMKRGAQKLYAMIERVRKAAHGSPEQSAKIKPEKFMPGGLAAYAEGGTAQAQGLSNWAGPYTTNYLSQANALAQQPYQAYTGPLTAGVSPIQQQAFDRAGTMTPPTQFGTATQMATQAGQPAAPYTPTQFSTGLGPVGSIESYMSPYTTAVSDVAAREARRSGDIMRNQMQSRMVQAGGYGGSRQFILEAEGARNVGQQVADIYTKGAESAYDRALKQRLGEAELGLRADELGERSRQFGADYGLRGAAQQISAAQALGGLGTQQTAAETQGLRALADLGTTQRDIEQQGLTAARRQFEEERNYPYQQIEFQRNMMNNLPYTTTTSRDDLSSMERLLGTSGGLMKLYRLLSDVEG